MASIPKKIGNAYPNQNLLNPLTSDPRAQAGFARGYFCYLVPSVASIAASGTASSTVQIESDSLFVWMATSVLVDISGAALTESARVIPICTLQITDTGSGRSIFNAPLPLDSVCGFGNDIYQLPVSRTFKPNASIRFDFANYSAATTYTNLRVVMHGMKVWDMQEVNYWMNYAG